jgi:hypothetical protein
MDGCLSSWKEQSDLKAGFVALPVGTREWYFEITSDRRMFRFT